jgi:hypothetical protein
MKTQTHEEVLIDAKLFWSCLSEATRQQLIVNNSRELYPDKSQAALQRYVQARLKQIKKKTGTPMGVLRGNRTYTYLEASTEELDRPLADNEIMAAVPRVRNPWTLEERCRAFLMFRNLGLSLKDFGLRRRSDQSAITCLIALTEIENGI